MELNMKTIIFICIMIAIIILCKKALNDNINEYFSANDQIYNAKPNVVIIIGDNINTTNISCYSNGILGYTTNNIDSLSDIKYVDAYGEMTNENGLFALLTGQMPNRTRIDNSFTTLSEQLKKSGYTTGYFGKTYCDPQKLNDNHFTDVVGYNNSTIREINYVNNNIQLNKLDVDEKSVKEVNDYIHEKAVLFTKNTKEPYFLVYNTIFPEDTSNHNHDVMEHDKYVGELLNNIGKNTMIIYTCLTGGKNIQTPFNMSKELCTDGNFRIPLLIKMPIRKHETVVNMISLMDIFPTVINKLGMGNIIEKSDVNIKIDGEVMNGESDSREYFIYNSESGHILGIRMRRWKIIFGLCDDKYTLLEKPRMVDLSTNYFENNIINGDQYNKIFNLSRHILIPAKNMLKDRLNTVKEDENINKLLNHLNNYIN